MAKNNSISLSLFAIFIIGILISLPITVESQQARKTSSIPPILSNCPGTLGNLSHCDIASYDFDAEDPDGDSIYFMMISGPGEIDSISGIWTYLPSFDDIGFYSFIIGCTDGIDTTRCFVNGEFTNEAPSFISPSICDKSCLQVVVGESYLSSVQTESNDCDPIWHFIDQVFPTPVGSYTIDSTTGAFTFDTDLLDGGGLFSFSVGVTDGNAAKYCEFSISVTDDDFTPDSTDIDGDSVPNECDNCESEFNPLQEDINSNGIGDACEPICCDLPGDFDGNNSVDIADLTATIDWMFFGASPVCYDDADVNATCGVDIVDLTYRVNYMFKGGPPLVCGCVG